jgi:hypothetical protein
MPLELDQAQLSMMIGTLLSIISGTGNLVPCHRYFADLGSIAFFWSRLPAFPYTSCPDLRYLCGLSNSMSLGCWPQNRWSIIFQTIFVI